MTSNQPNVLELAKQGNSQAIAALINRSLQPKGITAKAAFKDGCLQVMLESPQVPDQKTLVPFISHGIKNLKVEAIKTLKIFGKQAGEDFPAWTEELQFSEEACIFGNIASTQQQQSNPSASSTEPPHNSKFNKAQITTPAPKPKAKLRWFETESPVLIVGLLIIFFPLGLWSMWKYAKWTLKTKGIVTALFAVFVLASGAGKSPSTSSSSSSSTVSNSSPSSSTQTSQASSRKFIGKSKTGYELWADENCIYVKNLREADLARLNTDVWGFKAAVKEETGYKCVYFE